MKVTRRCPGCARLVRAPIGEPIKRHEMPAKRRALTGDYWCPAQGLALVGESPLRYERVGPGPEEDRAQREGVKRECPHCGDTLAPGADCTRLACHVLEGRKRGP